MKNSTSQKGKQGLMMFDAYVPLQQQQEKEEFPGISIIFLAPPKKLGVMFQTLQWWIQWHTKKKLDSSKNSRITRMASISLLISTYFKETTFFCANHFFYHSSILRSFFGHVLALRRAAVLDTNHSLLVFRRFWVLWKTKPRPNISPVRFGHPLRESKHLFHPLQ